MGMISDRVRQLPLHQTHLKHGAKFGVFGDWEVPLYYTSILEEHETVRRRAGLFDISHMGGFWFTGDSAAAFLNEILPRRVVDMEPGRALYCPLLNENGGFVDDVVLYRFSVDRFYLIVNAGNTAKDLEWITSRLATGVECRNASGTVGLLALQGPLSEIILSKALDCGLSDLKYYRFKPWGNGMIARTGYTGEDGFEILADVAELSAIWTSIMEAGRQAGIAPAGFGARDTLRLEAGMPLYGHDMNDAVTPLDAGLDWAVDLTKDFFVGKRALLRQQKEGIRQKLVGFEMLERGIPRQDYEIRKSGA
jgi:aminomethyltransferase